MICFFRIMKWATEEEKDSKGNAEMTIQIVILDISSKSLRKINIQNIF